MGGWRVRAQWLLALSVSLAAAWGSRAALAPRFSKLVSGEDVFALPPPEQTVVLSLGYRGALADVLYGQVLVDAGIHFQERRLFSTVGDYLDTINALSPTFREPYLFADTLLTMQPKTPPREYYYKAREILERGMANRPFDYELWSTAGQFMAYLAVAWVSEDDAVRDEWRVAGARALARACEMVGNNENIPYHCITAATLLSRAGQEEASSQFLRRMLAVTDDPEIRMRVLASLDAQEGVQKRLEDERHAARLQERWRKDLPFVGVNTYAALGPGWDPFLCAGKSGLEEPRCATTWKDWDLSDSP